MPYCATVTDYDYSVPDFEGFETDDKLFYMEFPINNATCSDAAKACGPKCCIDGAADIEGLAGGTVILGTRTYGVKQTGLGPSKDEMLEATVLIFEAQ